ncbi:hypothetical protein BDN72DRAFT_890898 [Pluteus cervinus]|uniref:Uncharacterized protein n=1 Tax=Pluteus cervinus TaxID=181527 RepID=A0ACD3BFZ6_9AGAR|nr:hypothetical protein BDN72DRAFT_890898 [Pluteus cervinus]
MAEPTGSPAHVAVDMLPPDPPPFEPYKAEFFQKSDGDIVSHDTHLNTDGEALYRFLLEQSAAYPKYTLHCRGTHTETRTRIVRTTINGTSSMRTETYTETITDFNFHVDFSSQIVAGPVHWSLADDEPAYRGLMVRQVQAPQGRRKATKEEIKSFKAREHYRHDKGLPPWIDPDGTDHLAVLQSSQTLRQWADEYCASPKILKEFLYEKFVHGWDIAALETAVRAAIAETGYQGRIHVSFNLSGTKIFVRPDNKLSRMLSKTWVKCLLMLFLIYPFIWLFKRFNSKGGGRWEVCGGAYGFKHVDSVRDGDKEVGETSAKAEFPALRSGVESRFVQTDTGPVTVYGLREGEWFKKWEYTIKQSAINHLQRSDPIMDLGDVPSYAARALDGYTG